jgi:hypothetical protein
MLGCDDTAAAVSDRASQERAELREEVDRLKVELRQTREEAKAQAVQLEQRAEDASNRGEDAAREAASNGKDARRPEETVLYKVAQARWPAFVEQTEQADGLPTFVYAAAARGVDISGERVQPTLGLIQKDVHQEG